MGLHLERITHIVPLACLEPQTSCYECEEAEAEFCPTQCLHCQRLSTSRNRGGIGTIGSMTCYAHETRSNTLIATSQWRFQNIPTEKPTQRIVEISSHMIELAMLASKCTAPPTIHNTYAIENNIVQMALNRNKINL